MQQEYDEIGITWRRAKSQVTSCDCGLGFRHLIENDEDSIIQAEDGGDKGCHGLRHYTPKLYDWLMQRVGAPGEMMLMLVFILLDGVKQIVDESIWNSEVNVSSMVVATDFFSLIVSTGITFILEGSSAVKSIANWHILWRFFIVAFMFQISTRLNTSAYREGTPAMAVKTLGYVYLPLSAVASYFIFSRRYGRLEWLALLIMMLAMAAFTLLRERCREDACAYSVFSRSPSLPGVLVTLASVCVSCAASLMAERIYKHHSYGLTHRYGLNHNRYYIHKVNLDICSLSIAAAIWCCQYTMWDPIHHFKQINITSVFGKWTDRNYVYVPVTILHSWMAGLIAKRYSTVSRALLQTVATAMVIILQDLLLVSSSSRKKFEQMWVPYLCMFFITILSAMIFQTGRINLRLASSTEEARRQGPTRFVDVVWQNVEEAAAVVKQDREARKQALRESYMTCLSKYVIIILYTLADATRTALNNVVVGHSMITPQSFTLVCNGCMLGLSNVLLFQQPPVGLRRLEALREAWAWQRLLKFMPCGFFFALTSALTSMAWGLGISSTMNVVVGKIYLPICAIVSSFVLGKYYMWLEWFAIIILTLDSAAFGFLKDMGGGGQPCSKLSILCCMCSAASSATSSMIMEKLMNSEPGKSFMMQKLRSDFACFVWSFAFLPVMGWLADPKYFVKGAFWRYRPLTVGCASAGACGSWASGSDNFAAWDGGGSFAYYGPNGTFAANWMDAGSPPEALACACGKGIFVCWDHPNVYIMLGVAVFYGFITGLMVTRFGGVMRAIADNFSLLLIYTAGDPLINGTTLDDNALNLSAAILPLSSQVFSLAADELRRVQQKLKVRIEEDEQSSESLLEGEDTSSGDEG